jgi:hypothetical protein
MDPDRLREFIREYHIRTIVNLRGCCPEFDWYVNECRVTHEAGVSQEDVTLSAIRLPAPSEVRRLLDVLEHSEYPILLHCRQGVDRTGLAAVLVKLLEPGVTLPEARRQLGLIYGYVPFNGTEAMRRFFDLYRDWLASIGCAHSPDQFRRWAMSEYCPGACRARVEWLDVPSGHWLVEQPRVIRIRAHNTSVCAWQFRPGTGQGVHARFRVIAADGRVILDERAGLFDVVLPPGESIDLDLGVPPLPAGRYTLTVDMIDADENAFSQFGFEPPVYAFRVGP